MVVSQERAPVSPERTKDTIVMGRRVRTYRSVPKFGTSSNGRVSSELLTPRYRGSQQFDTRRYKKQKGGFYPSVMAPILKSGPMFFTAAILQAKRLIQNSAKRLSSRKATRKTKRT